MTNLSRLENILNKASLLLLCLIPGLSLAEAVVIHQPQLKGEDFSSNTLLRIYSMHKKVWSDGTAVKVYTLKNDSAIHKSFVNEYLRMQSYQLNRLWHRLVFSGTGSSPEQLSSSRQMLETVKNTPGVIGYVDSSVIDHSGKGMMTEISHE